MTKRIILVHGRNYKPKKTDLQRGWVNALASGIERDFGVLGLNKFNKVTKEMAYYGHLSNVYLAKKKGERWTAARESANVADRKATLEALKVYKANEFKKKQYKEIVELEDVLAESAANIFSGPLSLLGIGDNLVSMVAPDMAEYWNPDSEFGSDVRWEVTEPIRKAMNRDDDIMLIAHSLGTIACYDVLWKLSYYGEYKEYRNKKVNCLVTLGSPLGDENVKDQLKGANASGRRKFPQNIKRWINVAAEDDYISHDPDLKNDYKKMLSYNGCVDSITDIEIFNMSVQKNGSNPHHSAGYLIHPRVSKIVHDWLSK